MAGGPPAAVTPSCSIRSRAASGSHTSRYTTVEPTNNGRTTKEPTPPMCASGNCSRLTSSGRVPTASALIRAYEPSVDCVCSTPLGSAVVPEV